MEKTDIENKIANTEESALLNRNRSFKSKQLVRSQAIRETHSPPRTSSPAVSSNNEIAESRVANNVITDSSMRNSVAEKVDNVINNCKTRSLCDKTSDNANHNEVCSNISYVVNKEFKIKQPVEIQITSGSWDIDNPHSDQRLRAKRWLGHKDHTDRSRDLLSNNPRVACVCGNCAACPHCRGRRRRQYCPTKQDSGIVCSDECPDCSDNEATGPNNDGIIHQAASLDGDEQNYYCRCPEKKEKPKNATLTRTDSDERSEPSGPELVNFIKETLNKNGRDRATLLKIERELHALINDTGRCIVRFPVMTSYGRMLVHRCASLFQLSHHLDQASKTCVVVSKSGTSGGRIPCTSFRQWCTVNFPPSPQRYQPDPAHAKSILKRDTHSLDEPSGGALPSNRSKSLEQREREYERVRRRIFSSENCAQDESQWPWITGPIKLLTSEAGRNKLLKVQSLETSSPSGGVPRVRGAVSKSHSFSGRAPDTPPTRLLSRQGDLASSSWRLSPSSSGYKTLSLRSTDSVTPSPTGGASPEPNLGTMSTESVVWAVTDLSSVPAGAVVIHPQTGRPLLNADGSLYHFDPAHPPVLYDISYKHDEFKNDNSEKKRGRLEKQNSFIDNECECQPSEECRNKCCSECRRHEQCQPKTTIDKETNTKPQTPIKTQKDNVKNETSVSTNHNASYEPPTNHNASYEPPTNHNASYEPPTNHNASYEPPTNYKPVLETPNHESPIEPSANKTTVENAREYEPTNQVQAREIQNNQRVDAPKSYEAVKVSEPTNQNAANEVKRSNLTNQESFELQQYQHAYVQGYRTDEVTSPAQATIQYIQPEVSVPSTIAKVAPVALPDPNIRPMSLSNMLYPGAMGQPYTYIGPGRVEQTLQPNMYQGIMTAEEVKLAPSPHTNDNTFRIDPSYPYGPIEYTAAGCNTCVENNPLQHTHRGYNMPYSQMEMQPVIQPTYPIGNVLLPQPHLQPYPYQEAVQWPTVQSGVGPKLLLPDMYPLVQYPTPYPQYNLVYPQMIPPQPYAICQPVYPLVENKPPDPVRSNYRNPNRTTGSCAHTTPVQTPPPPHQPPRRENTDIAVKIQQIKDQMAQMNAKEKEKKKEDWKKEEWKRDDWKRRNSNGLLGNYPNNNFNERGHGRTTNDESQLSNEARVIVNSIRNMQSKSTYHGEGRSPRGRGVPGERHSAPEWQGGGGRSRPSHPLSTGVYRPPYMFRQMSPNTWCRRSPGPAHPVLNNPRRPHPDSRNGGRR